VRPRCLCGVQGVPIRSSLVLELERCMTSQGFGLRKVREKMAKAETKGGELFGRLLRAGTRLSGFWIEREIPCPSLRMKSGGFQDLCQ
jgi:hypothetical protein